MPIYSVVTGTGKCIPEKIVRNEDFLKHEFYDNDGKRITTPNEQIIEKFKEITTIEERRYAADDQNTSDLALIASENAIEAAGINKEDLDCIIVAHNFAETDNDNRRTNIMPIVSVALKKKLGIKNPSCIPYDILFGCPGWVQGMIQADAFIKAGFAKKILVVGADILSRVSDPHDRDSMIFSDGAGAVIVEATESSTPVGIIAHAVRNDSLDYSEMLRMGYSYNEEDAKKGNLYVKMNGRRLYVYALTTVPQAIKSSLDNAGIHLNDISKLLLHQANGKMDDAIVERLYKLYDIDSVPEHVMPMTIATLGNSAVATVPTLFDMLVRKELDDNSTESGDYVVLASVGAGMSINSIVYKMP